MGIAIEKYVAKQQKKLTSIPRKLDLCWAMDLVSQKPVMFEVLNIDLLYGNQESQLLPSIQPGMLVKISVDWVSREHMNESFWIEVTNVNKDASGGIHVFGTCANNTERIAYGSPIGPIFPRNIIQVKE